MPPSTITPRQLIQLGAAGGYLGLNLGDHVEAHSRLHLDLLLPRPQSYRYVRFETGCDRGNAW